MTLTLTLPPEVEGPLTASAERHHLPLEAYVLDLLKNDVTPAANGTKASDVLQEIVDEGESQPPDGDDYDLMRALDEHRPAGQKLYPEELKGMTW